jgi:undecaprenyl-diphosphatase
MVGYAVLLLVFLPVLRGATRPIAIAVAVLMVLAIGFSRVALGVHYVSDVLAGYVLGAAWVAAMIASFNTWRRERAHGPSRPADGQEL